MPRVSEAQAKTAKRFARLDSNRDGVISRSEFVKAKRGRTHMKRGKAKPGPRVQRKPRTFANPFVPTYYASLSASGAWSWMLF